MKFFSYIYIKFLGVENLQTETRGAGAWESVVRFGQQQFWVTCDVCGEKRDGECLSIVTCQAVSRVGVRVGVRGKVRVRVMVKRVNKGLSWSESLERLGSKIRWRLRSI